MMLPNRFLQACPKGHLRELLLAPTLVDEDATRAEHEYLCAGSFVEYILRKRAGSDRRALLRELASLPHAPSAERVSAIEHTLGASIRELEDDWTTWAREAR